MWKTMRPSTGARGQVMRSGLRALAGCVLVGCAACSTNVQLSGLSPRVNEIDQLLFSTYACIPDPASGSEAGGCATAQRIERALLQRSASGRDIVDLLE